MSRTFDRGRALNRLTELCLAIRADWDEPGTRHAIKLADQERHSFDVIARAAVHAATTASTTTPAGITARLRDGWGTDDGWTKDSIDGKRLPTAVTSQAYPRCQSCHREILGGETRETHICKQRIDHASPARAEALAAMRAQAAEAAAEVARREAAAKALERSGAKR